MTKHEQLCKTMRIEALRICEMWHIETDVALDFPCAQTRVEGMNVGTTRNHSEVLEPGCIHWASTKKEASTELHERFSHKYSDTLPNSIFYMRKPGNQWANFNPEMHWWSTCTECHLYMPANMSEEQMCTNEDHLKTANDNLSQLSPALDSILGISLNYLWDSSAWKRFGSNGTGLTEAVRLGEPGWRVLPSPSPSPPWRGRSWINVYMRPG